MNLLRIFVSLCLLALFCCGGNDDSTNPENGLPALTTAVVSDITSTGAQCGGNITSDGGSDIISRGVCWNTNQNPTIDDFITNNGSENGEYTSVLNGLTASTTYYVRAYATNGNGTGYGNIRSFVTLEETNTVTDIDGNIYRTVTIGNQTWMAENLKVTHYRNGDEIDYRSSDSWYSTQPSYGYYNDEQGYIVTYGLLYKLSALTDSRHIAPEGWHIPTLYEWQALIVYLGGEAVAGGKMKDAGISYWSSPNEGATNESGFTALASGARNTLGVDNGMGSVARFWSSTDFDIGSYTYAWNLFLTSHSASASIDSLSSGYGLSVRCIKD